MPKMTINGKDIEVAQGTSVMQACNQAGVEVPRFCYHDKLSVAGCCRMCLVEVEKAPKPVASCTMPVSEGMVVKTDSPVVQRAQRGVMEMLLINHPLDCPVCDQGGACSLQDQAVAYGGDCSRFHEPKHTVQDKDYGPLIKTVMNRCIHCTRCVRFMEEIAGTSELGGLFRGGHLEITNADCGPLTSELSGNLADICSTGALTNKPFAFRARPWELKHTDSIDVLDAVGCNIRVDSKNGEVLRIVPRRNDAVNEVWINDKTRYACDGLSVQRLDRPYVRENGKLRAASWDEALGVAGEKFRKTSGEKIAALAGDLADCESMFALKAFMKTLSSPHMDCRQDGATYDVSSRANYIMNSTIAGIEKADAILLIGTYPRHEATMVNARIFKRWRRGGLRVGLIGAKADLTYPYEHIGTSPAIIRELAEGRAPFASVLREAKNPMVIVGAGALAGSNGSAVHAAVQALAETFNMTEGFNVLQLAAARVGGLDLGFLPQEKGLDTRGILSAASAGELDIVVLLGADEIDTAQLGNAFVVYIGHHGDKGAHRADVILPSAAYTEKDATYVNTEGRPQRTARAVAPPGEAREDWEVLVMLAKASGATLSFAMLDALRQSMILSCPHLGTLGQVTQAAWKKSNASGALSNAPFEATLSNFYMTDPISRASKTMAKCGEVIGKFQQARGGNHGQL